MGAACPACGEAAWRPVVRLDWRHYGSPRPVQLGSCCGCGSLRHVPLETIACPEALYGDHYAYREVSHAARFQEALGDYHHRVRPLLTPAAGPHRLLEVGCSHGYLLALLRELAGCEVQGCELDAQTARRARDGLGLEVLAGSLEQVRPGVHAPLDGIIMLDLLEHLTGPGAFLATALQLLRPGGWLLLETPQVGCLTHRLAGRDWIALLPHHPVLYTRRGLEQLLTRGGWTVKLISSTGNHLLGPRPWARHGLMVKARRLCQELGLLGVRRARRRSPAPAPESLATAWRELQPRLPHLAPPPADRGCLAPAGLGDALVAVARRPHEPPR